MDNLLSDVLKQNLESLAVPVRFLFQGSAEPVDEVVPPAGTRVWESPFALLALVVISSNESGALETAARQATDWLLRRLAQEEKLSRILDGYLVLALPEEPVGELRLVAQGIVLDTMGCRKHIVWPSDNDWTRQLWSVTALGLPKVEGVGKPSALPTKLPSAAQRALKLYQQNANYKTAADKLREEARESLRKEDLGAS